MSVLIVLLLAATLLNGGEVAPTEDMVYHLFFRSLNVDDSRSTQAARDKFAKAGLDGPESDALIRVVRSYNAHGRAMEREIERLRKNGRERLGAAETRARIARYQLDRLAHIAEVRQVLDRRIGHAGVAKLDAYVIEHVAPKVRAYRLEEE